TTSCNIGDEHLEWYSFNNQHPVIAQNLYRLSGDGRFEQIGMSWLKHGFCAVSEPGCLGTCDPQATDCSELGIGCADTYWADLNASGLGPRSDINASTGVNAFSFGPSGPAAIRGRLQAHAEDIDPAQNPGARYFAEAQYVTSDDAADGNDGNNASYIEVSVFNGGNFPMTRMTATEWQKKAITAWRDNVPGVELEVVDIPSDGTFTVGHRVVDNGDGTWTYEYAIHNLNSHASARSLSLQVPQCVEITDAGFHDVDYHSGEIYDGTDWVFQRFATSVSWSTQSFSQNPNANALRWGTMYTFWFTANTPPVETVATLSPFRIAANFTQPTVRTPSNACPAGCPSDVWPDNGDGTFGNGITNIDDLLAIINNFGGNDPNFDPAPDNGDGTYGNGLTNIDDLLAVINGFGPCPL
ncbi:MAG: hypothetical protein KC983_06545, partial [Phycisphaerales bacterium]|nr:hypothetical protein [Phycisphaerales bacterium]